MQLLLYIGGFFVFFALSQIFIGISLVKTQNRLKAELKLKQSKMQESETLIRNLPNPQRAIEDIAKKAEEFRDMEMNKKQLPRVINLLGHAINEQNLNLVTIKPRDDIKTANENLPTGVTKVYIEVTLNCSYRKLGEFLASLNKLPVVFVIENLSIQKKEHLEAAGSVSKKALDKSEEKSEELEAALVLSTYMIWEI